MGIDSTTKFAALVDAGLFLVRFEIVKSAWRSETHHALSLFDFIPHDRFSSIDCGNKQNSRPSFAINFRVAIGRFP